MLPALYRVILYGVIAWPTLLVAAIALCAALL
jgi:hypothetical protein